MDETALSRNAWAMLNGLRQPKGGLEGTMGADRNANNRKEGTRTKQTTNISSILLQPASKMAGMGQVEDSNGGL